MHYEGIKSKRDSVLALKDWGQKQADLVYILGLNLQQVTETSYLSIKRV